MPGYLEVFGLHIYSYAILSLLGAAAAAGTVLLLYRRRDLEPRHILSVALFGAIGLFLGAHLVYGLTNLPYLLDVIADWDSRVQSFADFLTVANTVFGGMVYYGGFLGLIAGMTVYLRAVHVTNRDYSDLTAVCIPLFHVFGRLGCFCAGCCYGIRQEGGIVLEHTLNPEVNGVPRLPVQLIEAGFNLLLFVFLLLMFLRRWRLHALLRTYCLLYPVERFALEYWRGDAIRGVWGPFSTSQWLSLLIFGTALVLELRGWAARHKTK